MSASQLINPKELMEPEELEPWELMDFDDLLHNIDDPIFENDLIYNKSYN